MLTRSLTGWDACAKCGDVIFRQRMYRVYGLVFGIQLSDEEVGQLSCIVTVGTDPIFEFNIYNDCVVTPLVDRNISFFFKPCYRGNFGCRKLTDSVGIIIGL